MSKTLKASATSSVAAQYQNSAALNSVFSGNPQVSVSQKYTSDDISKVYFNTISVGTTPSLIDLQTTTDAFGGAQSFGQVKNIIVLNNDAMKTVTVGGSSGSNLFGPLPPLAPGGNLQINSVLIVDSGHKVVELVSTGSATSVDMMVLGN